MNTQNVYTLAKWLDVPVKKLIASAYIWKYGDINERNIDSDLLVFKEFQIVPAYLTLYIRKIIYPIITRPRATKLIGG